MKSISLSLLALLVTNVASADPLSWADLEPNSEVKLASGLNVPGISLPAGTRFTVVDSTPLDIEVQVIELEFSPCPSSISSKTVDLEMADADYGIELAKDCHVSWYVEFKDLYRSSYYQ